MASVIFTGRRETQTTIEEFLKRKGVHCGLINGDTTSINQKTIEEFTKNPDEMHVIVSTEAGSEGVNLQTANVLVNYDLPRNPMIVEQRIGRIQRLASKHATVCIFNIVLQDTFEEYIVGRLMEKLQMVSSAVGDTEALLEVAGFDNEDGSGSFEEQIRKLVIASLNEKNNDQALLLIKSIEEAKTELKREENNMNQMLGGMSESLDNSPTCPNLLPVNHSMDSKIFVIAALKNSGVNISMDEDGKYWLNKEGNRSLIYLDDDENCISGSIYKPGYAPFNRLTNQIVNSGLHQIQDCDLNLSEKINEMAKSWVGMFEGIFNSCAINNAKRIFIGTALLRVTAIVAHDKYERLIEVDCSPSEANTAVILDDISPLGSQLKDPEELRVSKDNLIALAKKDKCISEFCQFYLDRLSDEMLATGENKIKKKKLEDDFTPQIEVSLVGLEGSLYREVKVNINYELEDNVPYQSILTIIPYKDEVLDQPSMEECSGTKKMFPSDCLGKCAISGSAVLKHKLNQSEVTGRTALPENTSICALTNKCVLLDEIEKSDVTGKLVAVAFLKISAISKKRAEPEFFGICEFSTSEVLISELLVSQISGKKYRMDEKVISSISNKVGHQKEFIFCPETNKPLLLEEAEKCEVTGKLVIPGLLETCEVTAKKVLSSELERSSVTGKKALKKFFVSSSISGARFIEQEAIRSVTGEFCAPLEAKICFWSGQAFHPDDLKTCQLTGLSMHFSFIQTAKFCSEILIALLEGISRKSDCVEKWNDISTKVSKVMDVKRCKVEAAEVSPDGQRLAICLEVRTWLGFKVQHMGMFYSIPDNNIVGKIASGRRTAQGWFTD